MVNLVVYSVGDDDASSRFKHQVTRLKIGESKTAKNIVGEKYEISDAQCE